MEGRFEDYQDLTQDSTQGIPREGELTFVPLINEITFQSCATQILVDGARASRRLPHADSGAAGTDVARPAQRVSRKNHSRREFGWRFSVAGSSSGPKPAARPASVTPYRKIFASYSHKDQDIAEEFARMTRAFGDNATFAISRICGPVKSGTSACSV